MTEIEDLRSQLAQAEKDGQTLTTETERLRNLIRHAWSLVAAADKIHLTCTLCNELQQEAGPPPLHRPRDRGKLRAGEGPLNGKTITRCRMRVWLASVVQLIGFLTFCFSTIVLCGYWAGQAAWTRWTNGQSTPMALNTATCIMLLSIGMMIAGHVIGKRCFGDGSSRCTPSGLSRL